jgi:hypothetical protein
MQNYLNQLITKCSKAVRMALGMLDFAQVWAPVGSNRKR